MVTILTPTYNRAYILPELFQSLKEQTCKEFKWLIIDDGSSDNTEEVVKDFQKTADFEVQYIKKQNGGKHTAVNLGVKHVDTVLTFIVDSDDQLLSDAVETVICYYMKYKDKKKIGIYSFLKCYKDGKNVVEAPKNEWIANYIDCRIKGGLPGDMAEVFLTECLKKYPFAEFDGERFLSEDTAWIEISKEYDAIYFNKAIYQCEYMEDGMTANDKPIKFKSPKGSMYRGKQLMYNRCGLKENVRGAIIYNCYKLEVKGEIPSKVRPEGLKQKVLVFLMMPLGHVFHAKWKKSI